MTVRVLSTPIAGSPLARIAIDGAESSWYVRRPRTPTEWKARADLARESLLSVDWLDAVAPALDAQGLAAERLARAAKSGIAVTAGQQPGLFGGPLYTFWKALSARSLADRLQEITGIPVVPIFWAATDDSDFAEACYTVVSSAGGAERIEMATSCPAGTPLSQAPLGDVSALIARLVHAAGSAPNGAVLDIVRAAYTEGATVGGAYVRMLRALLEPLGIAVLDAGDPSVRIAAHPLLRRALERSASIEEALALRSRELKASGHSPQVKLVRGRTLVFTESEGRRTRVRIREAEDLLRDALPGTLGPNVLLRPIVERSIIPTVAYLGGAGEIAYFAQTTAVADALEVPAPLIMPRWSGTVIEPRIDKILQRHSLTVEDFRDPHAVESRLSRESLPPQVREGIAELQAALERSLQKLAHGDGADLVPSSVLDGMKRAVAHRIVRLERRFAASVKRQGNEALHDAGIARASLFPFGVPQERALNVVPLLARHGADLVASVEAETDRHAANLA